MASSPIVQHWAAKNFKISKPKKTDFAELAEQIDGEVVLVVYEGSPAAALGIKPGWILFRIDKKPLDSQKMAMIKLKEKVLGKHLYEFFDPASGHYYQLKSKFWPFGINLMQTAKKVAHNLLSGEGSGNEDISKFWKNGLLEEMAILYPALETQCARLDGKPAPTSFPPQNAKYSDNVYADILAPNALGALMAGHMDRAKFLLTECESKIKQTESISRFTKGLAAYVSSRIAKIEGDDKEMMEAAAEAYQFGSSVPEFARYASELTGKTYHTKTPDYVGQKINLGYNLPNIDPVGEIKSNGKTISFEKTIGDLYQGQALLLFIMGSYRSNSYYNDDLVAAAPIFKAFNNIVKHIHFVTEGDYAMDANDRRVCENMAKALGMSLTILHDADGSVASQLDVNGYPSRLFFNASGTLICDQQLWDESGIWEAFSKL